MRELTVTKAGEKKKSSNKLNKIVLDFNPKYKINIYELLLSE